MIAHLQKREEMSHIDNRPHLYLPLPENPPEPIDEPTHCEELPRGVVVIDIATGETLED